MKQTTLSNQTILSRNENLFTSTIDNELVMLDEEGGSYYGLDSVGKKIWELLAEPLSFDHLIKNLTDIFEVDTEQCRQDTQKFITDMLENNVLQAK